LSTGAAVAQTVNSIVVEGNRRVEADTIRSYFRPWPGRPARPRAGGRSAQGHGCDRPFFDVRISHSGGRIVVTVAENPVINRVAFEGNKKAKDEQLQAETQSKPRGTLSRPTVQADVQRIIEIYHRSGRFDVSVDPKIIELPNNRVDLVFEIKEGDKTGIKEIVFVGARRFRTAG
jgi:outer membrane protein insertion porin family